MTRPHRKPRGGPLSCRLSASSSPALVLKDLLGWASCWVQTRSCTLWRVSALPPTSAFLSSLSENRSGPVPPTLPSPLALACCSFVPSMFPAACCLRSAAFAAFLSNTCALNGLGPLQLRFFAAIKGKLEWVGPSKDRSPAAPGAGPAPAAANGVQSEVEPEGGAPGGAPGLSSVDSIMWALGLQGWADRPAYELSASQMRKLTVAIALVGNPEVQTSDL